MSGYDPTKKTYVAPVEPPPERNPPATEVGLLGWLTHNLFSSIADGIRTIITLILVIIFLYSFLSWAIFRAQWEVVFLNLRRLGAGPDYPGEEVWRLNIAVYVVLFLTLLSVGFWGRIKQWLLITLGVIIASMIIIPILVTPVPEPPIYFWIDSEFSIKQVNFVADEGDEITFKIDPLADVEDILINDPDLNQVDWEPRSPNGYIANDDKVPETTFDAFSNLVGQVRSGGVDLTAYDLNVAVEIWDSNGETIAQSEFTEGSTDTLEFTWTAPADAWYTFTVVKDPENPGEQGAAFLVIENLEVFYSTPLALESRTNHYGEPPELECQGCATAVNRTDMRYMGSRTLFQWFSLQLSPYLVEMREVFITAMLLGLIGYFIGQQGKARFDRKVMTRAVVALWVISLPIHWVLVLGVGEGGKFPNVGTDSISGFVLTFVLAVVGIIVSFPIGVALALGRQSDLPVVSLLCTLFIELVRGAPLIALLFMGTYIVPFIVAGLEDISTVIRMAIVLTLFVAAYLAEVVRGGLQIVPTGQVEAAKATGLSAFQTTRLIVLPQALRAVIPAIMGQFVSLFKETALVSLIGLYEILGTMRRILGDTQTGYADFPREGYLYVAIVYFIFSYMMAEASRRLEATGAGAARQDTI